MRTGLPGIGVVRTDEAAAWPARLSPSPPRPPWREPDDGGFGRSRPGGRRGRPPSRCAMASGWRSTASPSRCRPGGSSGSSARTASASPRSWRSSPAPGGSRRDGPGARRRGRAGPPPRGDPRPHRLHAQGLGRNLYASLSVRENILAFASLFGQGGPEREMRIRLLLAGTGLSPFADREAGKLSGGMKQKLGLCCALIHDPDLMTSTSRRRDRSALAAAVLGPDRPDPRGPTRPLDPGRHRRPAGGRGFDWLVAMNDGRVAAAGPPDELRRAAGTSDLEAAFVSLVAGAAPPRRPAPARSAGPAEPIITARGLTCLVRRRDGGGRRELHDPARRVLRLRRLERLRQDDDDADADRPHAAERRRHPAVRPAARPADRETRARVGTCRKPSRSTAS